MIIHCLQHLKSRKIVLSSSSPRRKDILSILGIDFMVIPSTCEENLCIESYAHPSDYATEIAIRKAEEVARRLESSNNPPDLIIGADTCVVLDGEIYGKPKDVTDAYNALSRLSGKKHEVITGVSVMLKSALTWQCFSFHEVTSVEFANLSPQLISAYIATGEPMDKAGSYGIQGLGGTLIHGIQGDYFNVMGFPLHRFCLELSKRCVWFDVE